MRRLWILLLMLLVVVPLAAEDIMVLRISGDWIRVRGPVPINRLDVLQATDKYSLKSDQLGSYFIVFMDKTGPFAGPICGEKSDCPDEQIIPPPERRMHIGTASSLEKFVAYFSSHPGSINASGNLVPRLGESLVPAILEVKNGALNLCQGLLKPDAKYDLKLAPVEGGAAISKSGFVCPDTLEGITPGAYHLTTSTEPGIETSVLACEASSCPRLQTEFARIRQETERWSSDTRQQFLRDYITYLAASPVVQTAPPQGKAAGKSRKKAKDLGK